MSRSDKQAPWGVKAFYYPDWIQEHHYHVGRDCDLPERPTVHNIEHWGVLHCAWVYSREFMYHPLQRCTCYMCSHDAYGTPRRLKERREGKRLAKGDWKKEY